MATQRTFELTETILTEAPHNLAQYYERNHLRTTPDKTQICAFHLKYLEASRKLNITWYNEHIELIANPVYLGVTLDRTLSYKEYIHKLRYKTSARNSILRKLSNTNGEPSQRPSKQQLFHSATLSKLDPALNEACRSITGCLRPTSVENAYLLAAIALPSVRTATIPRHEIRKQTKDPRHSLYSHELRSRNSFIKSLSLYMIKILQQNN